MARAPRENPNPPPSQTSILLPGVLHPKPVASVRSNIWYRSEKKAEPGKVEIRWYYLGSVLMAFVQVYAPNANPRGEYIIHMGPSTGSHGLGFADAEGVHQFLKSRLETDPQ